MAIISTIINKKSVNKISLFSLFFLLCFPASAQEKTVGTGSSTVLSNPAFLLLLGVVVFLFILIAVFGEVLKAAAQYKLDQEKKKGTGAGGVAKTLLVLFALGGLSHNVFSQEATAAIQTQGSYWGLDAFTFYFMLTLIGFEVLVAYMLYSASLQLLGAEERRRKLAEEKAEVAVKQPSFIERLNASVAVEEEAEIMLDHNYDGIRELDNDLPPWWKYGFAFTILFSFVYLIHYQVLHTGQSPNEEYEEQLSTARAEIDEYRKKAANLVDENNAILLTGKESIESGRSIYMENCAPCHGKSGEGNVGPNLTDDYWLHKGGIKDVFRTIKYGWPEKGMKSWQQDLGAKQIHEVASFIMSLKGTNPPNAKEKQGELYIEAGSDSVKMVLADTTQVVIKEEKQ